MTEQSLRHGLPLPVFLNPALIAAAVAGPELDVVAVRPVVLAYGIQAQEVSGVIEVGWTTFDEGGVPLLVAAAVALPELDVVAVCPVMLPYGIQAQAVSGVDDGREPSKA